MSTYCERAGLALQVAEAIFQRYPNPFARHVLSEDTVHRELLTGGTLYTRRFITKTNKVPSWGEKYLSRLARKVPLMEESFIDTKEKIITLYTRGHPLYSQVHN